MRPHQNGHANAFTLHCNPSRQADYWRRLGQLSAAEREDFLRIYDAIAKTKAVTPLIRLMMESPLMSNRVSCLVAELANLIEQLSLACEQRNFQTHSQLHHALDDINIAVNARLNRLCLRHSAVLYHRYRALRQSARFPMTN
ncbi:MAG: hypothetical protein K0Q50_3099 [Vampirovibrio sp.]|jgi:hypothetical protein|nr:hypothetical protein [Vampirovibrio sp.]